MRGGVWIGGAPRCHRHGESVFIRTWHSPVVLTPWGQVGAHRLDLTHSRQPSLACYSVSLIRYIVIAFWASTGRTASGMTKDRGPDTGLLSAPCRCRRYRRPRERVRGTDPQRTRTDGTTGVGSGLLAQR